MRTAIVDLDLQFGDVGLCMGLPPDLTMYDLALAGGTIDVDKLDAYLVTHPSGARALLAPNRPDQAEQRSPSRLLQDVYAALRSELRLHRDRHAPRLHARGDRHDRRIDRPRDGRDARLALAQEHEARARDARSDGLRQRGGSGSSSTAPTAASASARATSSPFSAANRTSSSRATARSRAPSTKACRSCSPTRSPTPRSVPQLCRPLHRHRVAEPLSKPPRPRRAAQSVSRLAGKKA